MFHFFYVSFFLCFILFYTLSYSIFYLILYFILFCTLSYSVLYLILYFILFCTLSYSVLYPILYLNLRSLRLSIPIVLASSVFLFQSCRQVPFYCKFHFPIFRLFSIFIFIRSNGFRHPQTIHCRRENSARISRSFSTGIQSPYGRLQTVITKDSHRR